MYDLKPKCVRLDGTTVSGYWRVTEDGLFQLGHSKDHRPDLPQLKVMQAALDPLGMPLATLVASGKMTAADAVWPVLAGLSTNTISKIVLAANPGYREEYFPARACYVF